MNEVMGVLILYLNAIIGEGGEDCKLSVIIKNLPINNIQYEIKL